MTRVRTGGRSNTYLQEEAAGFNSSGFLFQATASSPNRNVPRRPTRFVKLQTGFSVRASRLQDAAEQRNIPSVNLDRESKQQVRELSGSLMIGINVEVFVLNLLFPAGTSRQDTVCENCQDGYFSSEGSTCSPWTK